MTDSAPCPRCGYGSGPRGAERYWEARWRDEKAHNDALVKALHIFLPPGNEPMEEIIWENQPDDAPMRITIKYVQYKKARQVLNGDVGGAHD